MVLPVKRFARAKTRLADAVGPPARAALLKAMLADVIAAVGDATSVERIIVVTGEGRAERVALDAGRRISTPLEVLQDPRDPGHSEAATLGIVRGKALGAHCVALLPGDCPLLDASELDAALGRMAAGTVAVVPDHHGSGTNGLLMAPGDAISPSFGPGSRERHLDRAERAGWVASVEAVPSLALDLDTPDDLEALRTVLAADASAAPATATVLEGL